MAPFVQEMLYNKRKLYNVENNKDENMENRDRMS